MRLSSTIMRWSLSAVTVIMAASPASAEYVRATASQSAASTEQSSYSAKKLISLPTRLRIEAGIKQISDVPSVNDGGLMRIRTPYQAPMGLPAAEPRGDLYGVVASFTDIVTGNEHYWGEINPATGAVSRIFNRGSLASIQDYEIQGGAVRDGILYVSDITSELVGGTQVDNVLWRRFDISTGDELTPVPFGTELAGYAYSMTYNPADDMFHILSLDNATQSFGTYATVDPKDGFRLRTYGHLTNEFLGSIAYNPADQQVYVFSELNSVYTIDPSSNTLTQMGTVDEDYRFIFDKTTTAMTYSPLDRSFVAFYHDDAVKQIKLLFIDAESFSVTESAPLYPSNPYFSMLYCADPYAELEAPAIPAEAIVNFDKASLAGNIVLTAPTLTYGRLPIESPEVHVTYTIDGKVAFEGDMAPGATTTIEFEGEEGVHNTTLVASIAGNDSPVRQSSFCLGHDAPRAPQRLSADGNVLTWEPVTGRGANNGYVEEEAITYDVFENGTRVNAEPLTECTYTIEADRDLTMLDVSVTASANGKTSAPAHLGVLLGNAISLPFSMEPTAEEFKLFQVIDANRDGYAFDYAYDPIWDETYLGIDLSAMGRANDWLILPLLSMTNPETLYNLSFTYRNHSQYDNYENLSIYIGREATSEAMTQEIYSRSDIYEPSDITVSVDFPVAEAGDYYIGFHCTSTNGYGMHLGNFKVESLADYPSSVPAMPKVNVVPAYKGELSADIVITAPTLDLIGNPLDADDAIEYTVKCARNTATVTLLPGATGTATVAVPHSGNTTFTLSGANSKGNSLTYTYRAYVGIDRPLAPQNIRYQTSADNMTVTMTWDAPAATGENGGYVDVDNLEYYIYTVEGVAFNHVGTTRELSYSFTPATTELHNYVVGPSARNETGESYYSRFGSEVLGRPNVTPLAEEFGNAGFTYNPVFYNAGSEFVNSVWQSISTVNGIGSGVQTDVNNGGMLVYNSGPVPTQGELVLPKVTTRASEKSVFRLRWLDWAYTPAFSLWGRRYGAEEMVKLADFTPAYPQRGEWREDDVILSDGFEDTPWAEFRVRAQLSTVMEEYGVIDSYEIIPGVDYDLKAASISGVEEATVGDELTYQIRVLNAGMEVINGTLTTTVTGADGSVISTATDNVRRLQSNQEYLKNLRLNVTAELLELSPVTITASVEAEGDEVPDNNTTSFTVNIKAHQAPVVSDLVAERLDDDRTVQLNWSEPDLTYGGDDSFEMLEPFAISGQLGMWTNYDFDQEYPFAIEGLPWPNNNVPVGWQAIDAQSLRVMNDPRLAPHSGKQYLMARNCQYDDVEHCVQASDWLVSPEVVGGTEVTLWIGSISSQYTEYLEVWYSEEEPAFDEYEPVYPNEDGTVDAKRTNGTFKYLRTFSKSGDESWDFANFTLPARARYFALRYASFDSFGVMIDDVTFTPARLQTWELDSYKLLRTIDGNEETLAEGLRETGYTDKSVYSNAALYNVVTCVRTGNAVKEGPRSNTASVGATGIDDIKALTGVYGTTGAIIAEGHAGSTMAIYTADGKYMASVAITSDSQRIAVDAGIYVVKAGNGYAKVLVK